MYRHNDLAAIAQLLNGLVFFGGLVTSAPEDRGVHCLKHLALAVGFEVVRQVVDQQIQQELQQL